MTARRITKSLISRALQVARQEGFAVAGYEIDGSTVRVLFGDVQVRPVSTLEERAEAYAQTRRMARRRG